MKIKESARVVYNPTNDCWEVHYGVTIPYRGTLGGCEMWCDMNKVSINNKGDINRLKYNNMPVWEGITTQL